MRPATRRICAQKGDGQVIQWGIPSGKLTSCYGKSPFFMGKSTISMPFPLAMLFTRGITSDSMGNMLGNHTVDDVPLKPGEYIGTPINHSIGKPYCRWLRNLAPV